MKGKMHIICEILIITEINYNIKKIPYSYNIIQTSISSLYKYSKLVTPNLFFYFILFCFILFYFI
ncbi:hypothetical protein PFAG_05684 [Plasmodium falciparum Santa Lucia]|uniref:Uncharacterized protein n=7 Tax=Plasmodium falciparum TaxID=5833 RepID=A0A024VZK3_PLAFA|nr:hypothetical protein PFFVO_05219 [Plasmodium falciparum Vietnam Oak-Knoll (FVO)]ETW33705.1 hypothetical protein PFTANZ_05568 [Plasmodium falciparum Tanzania (2000708)]ETW39663.1 hypothetical protein PFNF135_05692 [Plasmodium falciparum NF135/5.C10]ETW54250.1 hypothetical protein PFUGPA_04120 [Plasmodium falciparum Palo Alto/Uganda]ETW58564.1 hypothetical protein PFMC_05662 [Plasmodium falciparum CAMP/Malaysia]EUR62441.1 hypothetical protein PFBG_05652 [Plasmodium falciparum 7G8]EUT79112.1 